MTNIYHLELMGAAHMFSFDKHEIETAVIDLNKVLKETQIPKSHWAKVITVALDDSIPEIAEKIESCKSLQQSYEAAKRALSGKV